MTGQGKRQMKRFDLNVPAWITLKDIKDSSPTEFRTRNLCAGGAFIITDTPFKIGTKVDVKIHLSFFSKNIEYERRSNIHISGSVIRAESGGMAIKFSDNFQISPVPRDSW